MADVVARQLGKFVEISRNDHVYCEAVEWMDSRALRFRIFGYGGNDKDGFEPRFTYDVKGIARKSTY